MKDSKCRKAIRQAHLERFKRLFETTGESEWQLKQVLTAELAELWAQRDIDLMEIVHLKAEVRDLKDAVEKKARWHPTSNDIGLRHG